MLRSLNFKISSSIAFLNEKKKLAVYLTHLVFRIYFQTPISQERIKKCKSRQKMWTNEKEKTQMASRSMKISTLLAIKKWKR